MKKVLLGFIAGILVCVMLSVGIPALAAATSKTAEIFYNNIKISFDGEEVVPKDANGNVVEPFIMNGTTYLPLRAVANMVGLYVDWDSKTNTAVLSTTEIVKTAEIVDAINYEKDVIPTDAAKEMGWSAEGRKHTIKLPKITSETANAAKFNQKIYNEFSEIIDSLKSNQEYAAMYEIDYYYKMYNGIVGIVVEETVVAQMGGGSSFDHVFYYDLNNDKELTFDEYLDVHGVDLDDLQNLLKEIPDYEYETQYGAIKINDCILDDNSTIIYYDSMCSMSGVASHEAKSLF